MQKDWGQRDREQSRAAFLASYERKAERLRFTQEDYARVKALKDADDDEFSNLWGDLKQNHPRAFKLWKLSVLDPARWDYHDLFIRERQQFVPPLWVAQEFKKYQQELFRLAAAKRTMPRILSDGAFFARAIVGRIVAILSHTPRPRPLEQHPTIQTVAPNTSI